MTTPRFVLTAVLTASAGATIAAEDWPQWRGPSLNGHSSDRALPLNWSATENVTWKLAVPTVSGSGAAALSRRAPMPSTTLAIAGSTSSVRMVAAINPPITKTSAAANTL